MADKEIEVIDITLEKAKDSLLSQIPEGFNLISEQIISSGDPITIIIGSNTDEDARSKALERMCEKGVSDIASIKLITQSKKGFLGLAARPAKYEIVYNMKARILAVVGLRYCQMCGSQATEKYAAGGSDYWFCSKACWERYGQQLFQLLIREKAASDGKVIRLGSDPFSVLNQRIVTHCAKCGHIHYLPLSQESLSVAYCEVCKEKLI